MKKAKQLVSLVAVATLTLGATLPAFAATSPTTTTNGLPSTSVSYEKPVEEMTTDEAVVTENSAYNNLVYMEKVFYGEGFETVGVYPVIKGMDALNAKIVDKIFKAYEYNNGDHSMDYEGNEMKTYYSVEDSSQYSKVTIYINFVKSPKYFVPTIETYDYYIDKTNMTEITKEAYDAGVAAQTVGTTEPADVVAEEVTMLPLEEYATELGYTVKQEKDSDVVVIQKDGEFFTSIVVGSNSYMADGKSTELSSAPVVKAGVVYVPIDFFEVVLDAKIVMVDGTYEVTPRADLDVK